MLKRISINGNIIDKTSNLIKCKALTSYENSKNIFKMHLILFRNY